MNKADFRSMRRKAIRIINRFLATNGRINKLYNNDLGVGAAQMRKNARLAIAKMTMRRYCKN